MIKLWWIERVNGNLVSFGRTIENGEIYEGGHPNPFLLRRDAKDHCRDAGEKPVKVTIVKI